MPRVNNEHVEAIYGSHTLRFVCDLFAFHAELISHELIPIMLAAHYHHRPRSDKLRLHDCSMNSMRRCLHRTEGLRGAGGANLASIPFSFFLVGCSSKAPLRHL